MAKRALNDRALKALKPAPAGMLYDIMDAIVPGFGVRVSESGRRTFILVSRFPGSKNPTRRALGEYGAVTLEKARDKARDWLELIRRGVDPATEQERERVAEQRKRSNSFRSVAEDYFRLAVIGPDPENPKQRKGAELKRNIEREFMPLWADRPITEITSHDVVAVLDAAVERGAPYMAHNLLTDIRRLFNWTIGRGVYGLERSPCDRMRPGQVIGKKSPRTRTLNETEMRAFWEAAGATGYPYGPLFQMLLLTGQRKSEVAEAQWSEFDLPAKLWTVPAERMKAEAPHVVPLSDDVIAILNALPRFSRGGYLFSMRFGEVPVTAFSVPKLRLDAAILAVLRKGATDEKAAAKIKLPPFVIHDLRRTMRAGLSASPVSSDVAELVIAHARPGLRKVYDQYGFLDEKRKALDLWAGRLLDIVLPPPPNVVSLDKARA